MIRITNSGGSGTFHFLPSFSMMLVASRVPSQPLRVLPPPSLITEGCSGSRAHKGTDGFKAVRKLLFCPEVTRNVFLKAEMTVAQALHLCSQEPQIQSPILCGHIWYAPSTHRERKISCLVAPSLALPDLQRRAGAANALMSFSTERVPRTENQEFPQFLLMSQTHSEQPGGCGVVCEHLGFSSLLLKGSCPLLRSPIFCLLSPTAILSSWISGSNTPIISVRKLFSIG